MTKFRLGLLSSHPIQYQVPWLQRLARHPELDLRVLYGMLPDAQSQGVGFGVHFQWDIPLLEGYAYEVLENRAARPALDRGGGVSTPDIARVLQRHGFDAMIVQGWQYRSYRQAVSACRRLGIPCICRGESNTFRPRPWWKRLIHRRLLRRFSACLTIGKSNADFYRACGVREEQLFAAPYCVDNERFAAAADALRGRREELRAGWAIPPDKVVFLYCAKFIEKKQPMDLIAAAHQAAQQGAPVHLLMVGDGALRPACEEYARRHAVPASFAGFLNQTELPAAQVAADCFVLPSDSGETWGLVVNEAMATGLPAIVSDQVGCGPDLIVEGTTGMTFPCRNVARLAECLARAARDPQRLRAMGAAARRHIAAYSFAAAATGVVEAVRWVCRGKGQG